MNNKIKISLSADSILYFPLYLLAADPVSYGLNDFIIELVKAGDDEKALKELDNGFHFAVCDPVYLLLDKDTSKKAIKPLVIKSAIWITAPNDYISSTRVVKKVITHPKDTTASNCAKKIIKDETLFMLPRTGKFLIDKNATIVNVPIGNELRDLDNSSKINNEIIITSDILQLMSKKLDYVGLHELKNSTIFKKNIFTALISHNILLKRNTVLVEKMVQAIDSVLLSFMEKDKNRNEFDAIATKVYNFLEKSESMIPDKYTIDDIAIVLHLLYKNEFYPKDKTTSSLHKYWENSCTIAREGGAING